MNPPTIREILKRRIRRYLVPLRCLQILCALLAIGFTLAFLFIPTSRATGVGEKLLFLVGVYVVAGFVAVVFGSYFQWDMAQTRLQLIEHDAAEFVVDWTDRGGAWIGYHGLVTDGQFFPWRGMWDFVLEEVKFERRRKELQFKFVRETKAGVRREKTISTFVPDGEGETAANLEKQLKRAVQGEQLIATQLKESW